MPPRNPPQDPLRNVTHAKDDAMKGFSKMAFDKRHPVILAALRALVQTDGVVYGGFAMNLLAPRDRSFYKEGEDLFDIDVRSHKPKKTVQTVLAALKDAGFPAVSARPGLHEGTVKIYARGINVMDVTGSSKGDNNDKETILAKYHGIPVRLEGLNALVEGALLVLSKPGESGFRWEKMAHRLMALLGSVQVKTTKYPLMTTPSQLKFVAKNSMAWVADSFTSLDTLVIATQEKVTKGTRNVTSFTLQRAMAGLIPNAEVYFIGRHARRDIYALVTPDNCICSQNGVTCPAFRLIALYRLLYAGGRRGVAERAEARRQHGRGLPWNAPHYFLAEAVLSQIAARNNDLSRLISTSCVGSQAGLPTILERINS